jgi:hypothetical protein
MSERTRHGDNIADQIQQEDAYGYMNNLTASDLWHILDEFQTHIMDTDSESKMINMLSKWMKEIEDFDDEVLMWI